MYLFFFLYNLINSVVYIEKKNNYVLKICLFGFYLNELKKKPLFLTAVNDTNIQHDDTVLSCKSVRKNRELL